MSGGARGLGLVQIEALLEAGATGKRPTFLLLYDLLVTLSPEQLSFFGLEFPLVLYRRRNPSLQSCG